MHATESLNFIAKRDLRDYLLYFPLVNKKLIESSGIGAQSRAWLVSVLVEDSCPALFKSNIAFEGSSITCFKK